MQEASDTIRRIATDSRARLLAIVASRASDLAAAEDALSEAFQAALLQWPADGLPRSPEAWLLSVAKRRLLDEHRRHHTRATHEPHLRRDAQLAALQAAGDLDEMPAIPDERLKLLFVCAHPAIDPATRTPLMLQTVIGLDAARIASAFLVSPAAMSQRLVRAKTKIRSARIPFRVPGPAELPGRLESVLEAIYAAYGLEWEAVPGGNSAQRGLAAEAITLARVLVHLLPGEPETSGLLALLLHCEARRAARRDENGAYIPLARQNPAQWLAPHIAEAENLLLQAAQQRRPGRFQLEAAIQSAHAARAWTGETPLAEIVALYRQLLHLAPSVGAHVAYAAALHQSGDSAAALDALAQLPPESITNYQPYWAVQSHALHALGRAEESAAALQRAAGLTQDEATRRFLLGQLR